MRVELGIHPLETSRDVGKWKWQHEVRSMPRKRLPAIADRAVRERGTKGRAGIRWDGVVDKAWKETGRNQEDILLMEKFGGRTKNI